MPRFGICFVAGRQEASFIFFGTHSTDVDASRDANAEAQSTVDDHTYDHTDGPTSDDVDASRDAHAEARLTAEDHTNARTENQTTQINGVSSRLDQLESD